MSTSISIFFDTWAIEEPDARLDKMASAVDKNVQYDDPRTQETVRGIEALNDYVGMFSANAPGWSAKVLSHDLTAGFTRATVAFSGMGPDGVESTQLGQYFVEEKNGLITRMVGFVGIGKPE